MTIVASFQGTVTVPIFITPYTYTIPNGGTSAALINSVSSQPLVASNASPLYMVRQSSLGTISAGVTGSSVIGGWTSLLTPGYAATLQMTGPSSAGNGVNNIGAPIMYQNNLVNCNLQIYNNFAWVNYAAAPFVQNMTRSDISSPCMQVNELNTPAVSATNLEFVGGNTASLTNIVLTFGGVILGNFEGFTIPFAPAAATIYLATFLGLQKQAYCLNTGIGGASFFKKFVTIPAPESGTNYCWTEASIGGAIQMTTYKSTYELSTGNFSNTLGTFDTWQTDNAAINALPHVLTVNANSLMLSTNDGNDYIVSKDGKRYWQVKLVSNVSALYLNSQRTINGNYSEAGGSDNMTTRWIDKSGIMWYIGNANRNGTGLIQPGYSLALNIFPPAGIYLPQIPPMSGNCWSTCLDRIGGRPGNIKPTGAAN